MDGWRRQHCLKLAAAARRLLRQQHSAISPWAMLAVAGVLAVLLVISGVWHTSKELGVMYTDLLCKGGTSVQPWVEEALAEYSALSKTVKGSRWQPQTLSISSFKQLDSSLATMKKGKSRIPTSDAARGDLATVPSIGSNISSITGGSSDKVAPSFLLVGVLSVPPSIARRQAVRNTWMAAAASNVIIRFVMYEEEAIPEMLQEQAAYGDIVFLPKPMELSAGYRSIVYKTFALVEWVASHASTQFVLKTDDDAYVNIANLVAALKQECGGGPCTEGKLYMGAEKRNGVVITEAGNKWSNLEYFQLTGIREYVPYMFGGGYVFSADVAMALHKINSNVPLKFMPNEDATFGFWVMNMDLRRVDEPKMRTSAGQCCFYTLPQRDAGGRSVHARVRTLEDLCSGWQILHKVDFPQQMGYLHHRMLQCGNDSARLDQAHKLAASLPQGRIGRGPAHLIHPLQVYAMTEWRGGFHFSGLNDVEAWSADGSRLLKSRTPLLPHNLALTDQLQVGYIPFLKGAPSTREHSGWEWVHVASTSAWSYQLGARAQWVGPSADVLVLNQRGGSSGGCGGGVLSADDFCSVVVDARRPGVAVRVLTRPVYALSSDGLWATSLCFKRLIVQEPGFGYVASHAALEASVKEAHPRKEGLWLLDTKTSAEKLLLSLMALYFATFEGRFSFEMDDVTGLPYRTRVLRGSSQYKTCTGWISAAVFSADGSSIAFRYRLRCPGGRWSSSDSLSFVYTVDVNGRNLWRVPLVEGGAMDYGSNGRLLICDDSGTFLVENRKSAIHLQKPEAIKNEGPGPCQLFGDGGRFVLGDTTRAPHKLYVWDLWRAEVFTIAIMTPADWPGPGYAITSLNPQFSPDGLTVTFDSSSTWETGMQGYVVGVQHLQATLDQHQPNPTVRHLFCDLAIRDGAVMRHFIEGEPEPARWHLHGWEAGVSTVHKAALERSRLASTYLAASVSFHSEAVGVANGSSTIDPWGNSRSEVTTQDIEALLFPKPDTPLDPRVLERLGILATTWSPNGSSVAAPSDSTLLAGSIASRGKSPQSIAVQTVDFGAWLRQQAVLADFVVVAMDLGAGRDFEVLQGMLSDGSLTLIDQLHVRWRYQLTNWHEVATWEFVFALLGIRLDFL